MNTHNMIELPEALIAQTMLATEVRSLLRRYGERCWNAAIEAVLQSPEIQALRKDAERFRKIMAMTRAEREAVLTQAYDSYVIHSIDHTHHIDGEGE